VASCDDLDGQLSGKRELIARVAHSFIRRNGFIEYDDAIQIVSLAAWRVLENPPADGNVDAMIARIGFRRLTDELRSGRVTGIRRGGLAAGQRVPSSLNVPVRLGEDTVELLELLADEEDGYREVDDAAALDEALACLPDRERLVVYLAHYEDAPHREIGELLGVSESRISQLLARAYGRMRPALAA
jgi:RNA polymerase sigma factor (sigma-70 family)